MGALALAVPVLQGSFVLVAGVDGLILLGAAITLRLAPGIPYYFITLILFIALAGIFALCIGVLKVFAARELQRRIGGNLLSGALGFAGLVSVALGAGPFFLQPAPVAGRWLLIGGALGEGLALFVAAFVPWERGAVMVPSPGG